MKCGNVKCENEAEYDVVLRYCTKANGVMNNHFCECNKCLNNQLTHLLAYKEQYQFKVISINRIDDLNEYQGINKDEKK